MIIARRPLGATEASPPLTIAVACQNLHNYGTVDDTRSIIVGMIKILNRITELYMGSPANQDWAARASDARQSVVQVYSTYKDVIPGSRAKTVITETDARTVCAALGTTFVLARGVIDANYQTVPALSKDYIDLLNELLKQLRLPMLEWPLKKAPESAEAFPLVFLTVMGLGLAAWFGIPKVYRWYRDAPKRAADRAHKAELEKRKIRNRARRERQRVEKGI